MIQGRSVDLVRIEEGHTAIHVAIVRWRSDPENVSHFFGNPPESLEAHMEWFRCAQEANTQCYYAIMEKPLPGASYEPQPLGTISLYNIDCRNRRAQFGRFLIGDPSNRGRGYGREALFLLLQYAFRAMNLHRLWLETTLVNDVAHKLYRKMGFVGEGILRQHLWKEGQYRDIHVMGLLAEDFHKREEVLREELSLT